MSGGRKPEWPEEVRSVVLARVLDDDRSLNGVIRDLKAGTLDGFGPTPVPYSTARRWVDQEKARRARNQRPDVAAYNAAAERFWRLIGRELDKLERDARGKEPLDPKRLRETLGTLREARALIVQPKPTKDDQTPDQGDGETDDPPSDFLSTLPDPDQAADPDVPPNPEREGRKGGDQDDDG